MPSAGGGFEGFAALLRCAAKAVGHRGRHRYDGGQLHDATVAVTAAPTKERLQLGQGGVNQPWGQPAGVPGSQVSIAARSRRPGDHHGMSTRRASSPGRTSHTGGGWVVRSAWGCVPFGTPAARSTQHCPVRWSLIRTSRAASSTSTGWSYVAITGRGAERLPASLCVCGSRLVLRLVLFVDEPQLLEGARSGLRDGRWRTIRHQRRADQTGRACVRDDGVAHGGQSPRSASKAPSSRRRSPWSGSVPRRRRRPAGGRRSAGGTSSSGRPSNHRRSRR